MKSLNFVQLSVGQQVESHPVCRKIRSHNLKPCRVGYWVGSDARKSKRGVDTRVGFGSQTRFISGGASNCCGLPAQLRCLLSTEHSFCLRSDYSCSVLFCSIRFRPHSLLPRDMARAAFVSSTGDVEE